MGVYNLAKKGHRITNDANAVHCERLGMYNLTKKGDNSTNDINAVHSETMGVYNLAKKRATLLSIQMQYMHSKNHNSKTSKKFVVLFLFFLLFISVNFIKLQLKLYG